MVDLLIGVIVLQVIIYASIAYKIDKLEEKIINEIKSQEANDERVGRT